MKNGTGGLHGVMSLSPATWAGKTLLPGGGGADCDGNRADQVGRPGQVRPNPEQARSDIDRHRRPTSAWISDRNIFARRGLQENGISVEVPRSIPGDRIDRRRRAGARQWSATSVNPVPASRQTISGAQHEGSRFPKAFFYVRWDDNTNPESLKGKTVWKPSGDNNSRAAQHTYFRGDHSGRQYEYVHPDIKQGSWTHGGSVDVALQARLTEHGGGRELQSSDHRGGRPGPHTWPENRAVIIAA